MPNRRMQINSNSGQPADMPKKRPQEFRTGSEEKGRAPMTAQERAVLYQNVLQNRLNPDERDKLTDRQENMDVSSLVGAGIEKILKGMYAGGAGSKDTDHWDKSRRIFKERQNERERRKDKRLTNLEKLQKHESARSADDPTSPKSRQLQGILTRMSPNDAKVISELSENQIYKVAPWFRGDGKGGRGESSADQELKKAKAGYYNRRGAQGSRESEADKLLKGAKTRYYDRKPGESDVDAWTDVLKMKILSDQQKTSSALAPGSPAWKLKQQIAQAKLDKARKAKDKAKDKAQPGAIAQNTELRTLGAAQAKKKSILAQIKGYQDEFKTAETQDDKIRIGRMMLKTLNSTEGADAIGVEEAKRLGDALEFQIFNILQPGPMFGRDLPGFDTQITHTVKAIESAVRSNQELIDKMSAGPDSNVPGDTIEGIKKRLEEYQQRGSDGKARLNEVLNKQGPGSEYPKYLYKDGKRVTARNKEEEAEATGEGWNSIKGGE